MPEIAEMGYPYNVEEVTFEGRYIGVHQDLMTRALDCADAWYITDHGQVRSRSTKVFCYTIAYTPTKAYCAGLYERPIGR